jgi:tetratricopeptide (TPR) repeat protein
LEVALARHTTGSPTLRARALWLNGWLAWLPGDIEHAQTLYAASLALAQAAGDQRMMARALAGLGALALERTDVVTATAVFEEGLRHARDGGDRWARLLLLWQLGTAVVGQGDTHRASTLFAECVTLARATGEQLHRAQALYYLGSLALLRDDLAAARSYLEEGLAAAPHWSLLGVNHVPEMLGRVLVAQGDLAAARELLIHNLRAYQAAGSTPCILHALEGFARLALGQAQPERAVRLLSAAATWQTVRQLALRPIEQMLVERTTTAAQACLSEAAFATAWAHGQALSLEQAMADALAGNGAHA